jgi:hypothetical protein
MTVGVDKSTISRITGLSWTAILSRKTPSHARDVRTLKEQLELFQCYDNFIRPQSTLKFRIEVRTAAKQTGLIGGNLGFRDIVLLI